MALADFLSDDGESLLQPRSCCQAVSCISHNFIFVANKSRWSRMQKLEKESPPQFLSTHPSVSLRIIVDVTDFANAW